MQVYNLVSGSATGTGWGAFGDATIQTGDVISVTTSNKDPDATNAILTAPFQATSGKPYTLTADIKATANFRGSVTGMVSLSVGVISITVFELTTDWSHVSVELTPSKDASDAMVAFLAMSHDGLPASLYVRDLMLVEGTTPAAWAPAEGETISGVGALTSDNLLEGITPNLSHGASATDDGFQLAAYGGPDHHQDQAVWDLVGQSAVESNQTMTASLALMGDASMANAINVTIGYKDSAGNINWCGSPVAVTKGWEHAFATLVVPAGMTPARFYLSPLAGALAMQVANVSLRFGGRKTLASACHTPYVTQEHADAVFATQASLTFQADRITSEVAARQQTDGNLSTLSTKVNQTADGLTTEISDRKQAVSAAQAAAVNSANASADAKLGSYTKTADLADTDAVKDAKKAGTDAQEAAGKAQSTANGAAETANATATMIRQYEGGVLVAKTGASVGALVNANGSFDVVTLTLANDVPSVSGTLSSFDTDSVNLLRGAARFYVKQWSESPKTREVRISSPDGAIIILGVDDEATNGGLYVIPENSPMGSGMGGEAGCEWPFYADNMHAYDLYIKNRYVAWQSASVELNTSSSLLGDHSESCYINAGLGLAYLAIDMTFESPGWKPGTGTWIFQLPEGLRPKKDTRLYNLISIYINGRWGAHVDVHSDGYCYPTWGWQAENIMCATVFPLALLGL